MMRPYATAGVALVGASLIAVTLVPAPPPSVQTRAVQLVDAWSDLFSETTTNLQSIASGEDSSAISTLFSDLSTNPLGVIQALTDLDPTIDTSTAGTISIELTPALELGIAQLGAEGAAFQAIEGVVQQLESDPTNALSTLYEGTATVLNAYLNGAENVSLLDGTITFAGLNGILAPELHASATINLSDLLNVLGLGNLDLTKLGDVSLQSITLTQLLDLFPSGVSLDGIGLGSLLNAVGVGDTSVGQLLGDVPGIGTLLGPTLLGDLDSLTLDQLVNGVTIGNVNLSNVVTDLFGTIPSLNNLTLEDLLTDLGMPNLLNGLNLGDLLNNNLLDISVSPLGGLITELVDTVPQQIVTSLSG